MFELRGQTVWMQVVTMFGLVVVGREVEVKWVRFSLPVVPQPRETIHRIAITNIVILSKFIHLYKFSTEQQR
jgi:hypothetical protein